MEYDLGYSIKNRKKTVPNNFTLFGFNGLSSANPISSKNTTDCVKEALLLLFAELS